MQGDLEQIQLADVLQTLATTKMEGTMRIRNPLEDRHAYCKDGRIRVHVPQRVLSRRIGQRLVNAGVVTVETLRAVLIEQRKDKRPLGALMVAAGHCSQQHIDALLEEQAAEDVYALFTWRHGAFELWKGAPGPDMAELFESCFEYDINSLLLEVARRSDEWETILAAVGSLDEVPQRLREGRAAKGLQPAQAEMLNGVDGYTSYRELSERSSDGMFAGARAARDLVRAGWLGNADDETLVGIAQRLADGGNGKRAVMTLRTLVARPGERRPEIVRSAAECLDLVGERKLASSLLLEAAQRHDDSDASLELARRAKELDPHDVGTLSYLRTTLLAHLPADSPELEKCTLELLDALISEGRTGTALEIVDDARTTKTISPGIMLREARARQKSKDVVGAVTVLKELAELHDARGEVALANNAYALLLRIDRSRKDIAKLLKQRTRTRGARIARAAVAAAIGLTVLGLGIWSWSRAARQTRLEEARVEIADLVAKRQFEIARAKLAEATEALGEIDEITDLRTQLAYAKAQDQVKRQKQRQEEFAGELARAAEALESGRVAEAVQVYGRLADVDDRKAATVEAAERRLRALTVRLGDIARNLQQQSLPLPEQLIDRKDLVEAQQKLNGTADAAMITAAKEFGALVADKGAFDFLSADMQKHLATTAGAIREAFGKAETLAASYAAAMARNEQQRRLDPLFQRAVQREAANDFTGALADYMELERHSTGEAALLEHFRERIARNTAITRLLHQQVEATKAGDFFAARQHLRSLCEKFPEIGFERIVRLPLNVETRPAGAQVTVNGEAVGVTPLRIERAPKTASDVAVDLAGFARMNETVLGEDKERLAFDLRMQPQATRRHPSAIETPPLPLAEGLLLVDRSGTVTLVGADGFARWTRRTDDLSGFLTRPVVVGTRAFFGSVDGDLRCVDLATGALQWSCPSLPMDLAPRPAADGVACVTTSGDIVFVSELGKVQRRIVGDGPVAGFWIDADRVTTLGGSGQLRQYDGAGKPTIERRITDAEVVAIARDGDELLVCTERGRLQSIAAATGATNWDVDLGGEPLGAPIVTGAYVWQTLRSGMVKLDRTSGARQLVAPATDGEHSAPAQLFREQLVVPTAAGPMVCSLETGAARYRLEGSKRAKLLASAEELWVVEPGHAIAVYRNLQ